jgi:DnaJ-class molecular chaperone
MPQPQTIDFDPHVDYYAVLGVVAKARADDIKRAYRKLAKQYHPDATGGDKEKERRFKDVQGAYDVLGNAKKKALYDEIRAGTSRGTYNARQAPGPSMFDLGDLFSQFFGVGGGIPHGRVRVERVDFEHPRAASVEDDGYNIQAPDGTWLRVEGTDVHSEVRISFDRAIFGDVVTVATMHGQSDVKIPPHTSSGKKLRLRGKGVAGGDHYVIIQIDVPSADELDDEGREILDRLVARLRKRRRRT